MIRALRKKIAKTFSFKDCLFNQKSGFTIAELMVVGAIFAVITGIVVFRYGDFNSNILVTNMAYEIALTARQAQVFGLGARGFNESGANTFQFPYGLFINMNDGSGDEEGETKQFIFFVDRSAEGTSGYGRCSANSSGGTCTCGNVEDECTEQVKIRQNIKITELRVGDSVNQVCETNPVEQLAITFKRPSPEARIVNQGTGETDKEFAQIKIETNSSSVDPAYVMIRKTGQISVSKNDECVTIN
jgi:hypothetical protein